MLTIIGLLAASAQAPGALAPAGKWSLDYSPGVCTLSRGYGSGDAAVTVAFRPLTLGETVEVVLISTRGGSGSGSGTIGLDIAAKPEETRYQSVQHPQTQQRIDRIWMPRTVLDGMPSASALSVKLGSSPAIAISTAGAGSALNSLAECEKALIAHWGVIPLKVPEGGTPPKAANDKDWIKIDDYPVEALARREEGTTTIFWTIDVSGRVRDCRAVVSSGSASLDKASCEALSMRGRYEPARAPNGTPVPVTMIRKVAWSMPR